MESYRLFNTLNSFQQGVEICVENIVIKNKKRRKKVKTGEDI